MQRKCRCGNVYDSMIRKETVWWLNRSPVIILISLIYLVKGFRKTQRKTKTEFQGGGAFISSHSGGANWPCFVGASQVTRPVIFTQLSKFRMFDRRRGVDVTAAKDSIPPPAPHHYPALRPEAGSRSMPAFY